jgi:hypothetical protein
MPASMPCLRAHAFRSRCASLPLAMRHVTLPRCPRPLPSSDAGTCLQAMPVRCLHPCLRPLPACVFAPCHVIAPHAVQDRCLGPDACIHAFALTPSARDTPCHARTRTMMQSCASAAKLRSGGPILPFGVRAKRRLGIPPPRTVIGVPSQAYGQAKTVVVPSTLRTRKAEGQNQLRPSTRAVEGFAGVWVTIRACGEVGFRLTAEAEIGRSRFADGPSAVLSIEFQHAVGGGCAVRDLGFRFFAHVLPSSSGHPPARSRNVVLGWW